MFYLLSYTYRMERIGVRELNQQIGGFLSTVILHKIKEQMSALLPSDTFEPVDTKSAARYALCATIDAGSLTVAGGGAVKRGIRRAVGRPAWHR